jgi:hypothetical protein
MCVPECARIGRRKLPTTPYERLGITSVPVIRLERESDYVSREHRDRIEVCADVPSEQKMAESFPRLIEQSK